MPTTDTTGSVGRCQQQCSDARIDKGTVVFARELEIPCTVNILDVTRPMRHMAFKH